MIYCIKRNVYNFFNKWIFNLVFIITCIVVSKYYVNKVDSRLFIDIIFTNTNDVSNFIYLLYKFIFISYLLYMCYYIYSYDIKNNPEFVFLRISNSRIVNTKYFSLLLINLFVYFVIYLICIIFGGFPMKHIINSILFSFLFNFSIESIFLIFQTILGKYSIIVTLLVYFVMSIYSIGNKYMILVELIIILVSYLINKRKILRLVEKERNL